MITHILNNFIIFSRQQKKEGRLEHSIFVFDYIELKESMGVSHNFKTALDHNSLYRSIYLWCHHTILKKNVFNRWIITWNKQVNFNKHCPTPPPPPPPHHPSQNSEKFQTSYLAKPPPEVGKTLRSL